ncbi:hypothetical protein [Clostridium sp. OM02-18AC]|uniref:hypothetical protein n=2 Tax=unclassified Clostridium TaxID=2614128 RepID=UPI0011C2190B|nr:hypothetical protein [Clostridium sp. OM02-18AC]
MGGEILLPEIGENEKMAVPACASACGTAVFICYRFIRFLRFRQAADENMDAIYVNYGREEFLAFS